VHIVIGILLLIAGVIFPLAMLFWLNGRMSRQPALSPRQVGLILTFNGVLPVGLITLGVGLLSPRVWTSSVVRTASFTALAASAALLIAWVAMQAKGGDNER
jgi:hypothetical protein